MQFKPITFALLYTLNSCTNALSNVSMKHVTHKKNSNQEDENYIDLNKDSYNFYNRINNQEDIYNPRFNENLSSYSPIEGDLEQEQEQIDKDSEYESIIEKEKDDQLKVVLNCNTKTKNAVICSFLNKTFRPLYNRNNTLAITYKDYKNNATKSLSITTSYCKKYDKFFLSKDNYYIPKSLFLYDENNDLKEMTESLSQFLVKNQYNLLTEKEDTMSSPEHSFIKQSLEEHYVECPCKNLYLTATNVNKTHKLICDPKIKIYFNSSKQFGSGSKRMYIYWDLSIENLIGVALSPKNIKNIEPSTPYNKYKLMYFNGSQLEIIRGKKNFEEKINEYLLPGYKIPELHRKKENVPSSKNSQLGKKHFLTNVDNNADLSKKPGVFYKKNDAYYKASLHDTYRLCASINPHEKQGIGYCNFYNSFYSKSSNLPITLYIKEKNEPIKPLINIKSLEISKSGLMDYSSFFENNVQNHSKECVCNTLYIAPNDTTRYIVSLRKGRADITFSPTVHGGRKTKTICWDNENSKLISIYKSENSDYESEDINLMIFSNNGFEKIEMTKNIIETTIKNHVKTDYQLSDLNDLISDIYIPKLGLTRYRITGLKQNNKYNTISESKANLSIEDVEEEDVFLQVKINKRSKKESKTLKQETKKHSIFNDVNHPKDDFFEENNE